MAVDFNPDHVKYAPCVDEEWEKPEPITGQACLPLPPLSAVAPPTLAEMASATAATYQVPPDMPLLIGLAVITASAGGRFVVDVKDAWEEQLSLMTAVGLGSGNLKSPVLKAMARPLVDYEVQTIRDSRTARRTHNSMRKIYEDRAEKIQQQLGKKEGSITAADHAEIEESIKLINEYPYRHDPQFLADDSTPEALAELMHQQGGRISVLSAEGGLFTTLGGRYNKGRSNIDLVLKAHSGDEVKINRKGHEPLIIERPVMSMGMAVQPHILAKLSTNENFRDAGFIARFLYALPKSLLGTRSISAPSTPESVIYRWHEAILHLARCGLTPWHDPADPPQRMKLTHDAVTLLDEYRTKHEPRLGSGGDLSPFADWASKLPGQLVRIAAAYTLLETPGVMDVPGDMMARALGLADYLESHAVVTIGSMSGRAERCAPAVSLLERIKAKEVREFSLREMHRWVQNQPWVEDSGSVRTALAELVETVHVLPIEPEPAPKKRGAKPSPRYAVNPHVFE